MAHFAKLSEENLVLNVEAVADADTSTDGVENEAAGVTFLTNIHGWSLWKKCSYNTRGGKYYDNQELASDQSKAYRKNYPSIGYTWDAGRDAFIPPKELNSNVLNETTCLWQPPVAYPSITEYGDPVKYYSISWDETNVRWVGTDKEDPQGSFYWNPESSSWIAI